MYVSALKSVDIPDANAPRQLEKVERWRVSHYPCLDPPGLHVSTRLMARYALETGADVRRDARQHPRYRHYGGQHTRLHPQLSMR